MGLPKMPEMPEFPSFPWGTAEITLLEKGLSAPHLSKWTQMHDCPSLSVQISPFSEKTLQNSPFLPVSSHLPSTPSSGWVAAIPGGISRGAGMGQELPGSFSALLLIWIPRSLSRLPSSAAQGGGLTQHWHPPLNSCSQWHWF